jgi:hypothetical protein
MLHESLAICIWTCVHKQTSVEFTVNNLNAVVKEAIAQAPNVVV